MSRAVSDILRAAVNAQDTAEVYIILLTLDHPELDGPIRLTSDAVDTVSRGETFAAVPIDITLPDDTEDRPPTARLTVSAVDRTVVQAVRSINTSPSVTIEVVLASDPDRVEVRWPDLELRNVSYDAVVVSGEVTLQNFAQRAFPARRFDPATFPGLFQ